MGLYLIKIDVFRDVKKILAEKRKRKKRNSQKDLDKIVFLP